MSDTKTRDDMGTLLLEEADRINASPQPDWLGIAELERKARVFAREGKLDVEHIDQLLREAAKMIPKERMEDVGEEFVEFLDKLRGGQ